jgi:hypothetical protein
MLDPDPNPDPEPEYIAVLVPLRQKVAIPQDCSVDNKITFEHGKPYSYELVYIIQPSKFSSFVLKRRSLKHVTEPVLGLFKNYAVLLTKIFLTRLLDKRAKNIRRCCGSASP